MTTNINSYILGTATVQHSNLHNNVFGQVAGTAVEGDTQLTITTSGNLSGGGTLTLGAGGTINISYTAPTALSDFTNDTNYIANGDDISLLTNNANYVSSGDNISVFNNNVGYVTSGSNVSVFINDAGYLTSFTETDPTVPSHVKNITTTNIANWNTAYGWGDHSTQGYLTSYTDTNDIDYINGASFDTTTGLLTLSGVGNAGATVDLDGRYSTTDTVYSQATSTTLGIVKIGFSESGKNYPVELNSSGQMFVNVPWVDTDTNVDNYVDSLSFNTGNGILTAGRTGALSDLTVDLDGRYLTSYTETDTLDSVTTRGNTTTNDITVNDITVSGNLTVQGTTTTINAAELHIEDNLIYLNEGSTVTNPDLGWSGNYNDGIYAHAGMFRDATDGVFKAFEGYTPEPGQTIDTSHASFSFADMQVSKLTSDRLEVKNGSTGLTILPDLATQQYMSATGTLNIITSTGSLYLGSTNGIIQLSSPSTVISGTLNNHTIPSGTGTFALTNDIPSNVSAFTNDAGYLTSYTDTNNYLSGLSFNTSNGILTATRQGLGNLTVDLDGRYQLAGSYAPASHTHAFNDLTGKSAGTGEYSTSSHLTSGRGSGGVSLTINDGYGNANVTWNHKSGVPEQNGNAARIEVNTDSTTGATMYFELGSGVTSGQAINLSNAMTLKETAATFPGSVTATSFVGNASTATKWATGRTLSLTGDVTGSVTGVDGSGNISIETTIASNSVALGTDTTGNYTAAVAVSGNGLGLTGTAGEGTTFTVTSNAVSTNTANTLVYRDANGDFSANTITATATKAQYADLAEKYTTESEHPVGTVMMVSFNDDYETAPIVQYGIPVGVISEKPAFLMNEECDGQALALKGRVPVRVHGAIRKGEVVYVYKDGLASKQYNGAEMVGIALETNIFEGEKLVECVLKL